LGWLFSTRRKRSKNWSPRSKPPTDAEVEEIEPLMNHIRALQSE
jgi:hypothetical protein